MLQTLNFVRETGTERPRGTNRRMIRSQARTKRSAGRKNVTSKDKLGEVENNPSKKPKKVRVPDQRSSALILVPQPGTEGRDPFSALPVSKHGHADELLHYCRFLLD
jgi:hypothetical protein